MNAQCKGCTDRYVGCHSECAKYKDYVQQLFALKQQIKEGKTKEREWIRHYDKATCKAKRRSGKK